MTRLGQQFIDSLRNGVQRMDELLATETDPVKRSVYMGWRDCYELVAEQAQRALPDIEAEAFLVPQVEERIAA